MYGVIGLLDKESERIIRKIWNELAKRTISFYAEDDPNRKPHITLASYRHLNETEFIHSFKQYYLTKHPIDIHFNILGTFLGSGTLFLSPTLSETLLQFHRDHHEYFKGYQDNPHSLYLPGNWVPHCTIANRLSREKVSEAYEYCSNHLEPIHAKITDVSLINVMDGEHHSLEIYTKKLLGEV